MIPNEAVIMHQAVKGPSTHVALGTYEPDPLPHTVNAEPSSVQDLYPAGSSSRRLKLALLRASRVYSF